MTLGPGESFMLPNSQCDQKLNKISPNFFEKVAKKAKISTSKLTFLKPKNICNKPSAKTACVCEVLLSKK